MRPLLRILPFLVFLSLCAGGQDAHAQTVTIAPTGVDIRRETERSMSEDPTTLSKEDCVLDDPLLSDWDGDSNSNHQRTVMEFTVSVTAPDNDDLLQVWVSQSATCTDQEEQRAGGRCRLLSNRRPSQNNETFKIRPRLILADAIQNPDQLPDETDPDSFPDSTVCDSEREESLTFWAIYYRGDDVVSSATWEQTSLDTRAPDSPAALNASAGESRIFLDWAVEESDEEDDLFGYTFYCEEAISGTASVGGAGGAASTAACQPLLTGFVEGESPPLDATECGKVDGQNARDGRTSEVTNGTLYAVAIAATDNVGNQGKLSAFACATPELVDTFFEQYRQSGGKGGDFCRIGHGGGSYAWLLLLAAALSLGLRRARGLR